MLVFNGFTPNNEVFLHFYVFISSCHHCRGRKILTEKFSPYSLLSKSKLVSLENTLAFLCFVLFFSLFLLSHCKILCILTITDNSHEQKLRRKNYSTDYISLSHFKKIQIVSSTLTDFCSF